MFSLTHGHLNLLSACPRKFQYLILEQLTTPISIDQQSALDWGQQFHLLIQQQDIILQIFNYCPFQEKQHYGIRRHFNVRTFRKW